MWLILWYGHYLCGSRMLTCQSLSWVWWTGYPVCNQWLWHTLCVCVIIFIIFIIKGKCSFSYTGCNRRNGPDFGRVFLMLNYTDIMLNYTDITQNTYIQSWTVTEIMAIEMYGLLGCRRTVRRPRRHTCPMRTPTQDMVMQSAHVSSDVTR